MDKKEIKCQDHVSENENSYHPLTLEVDIEYYQSFLDDMDISDEKKRELIETLWNIVVQFVDLGFGIAPIQQAIQEDQKDNDVVTEGDRDAI